MGVTRFTVVLSHWHLDHVGGNDIYADSKIISTVLTRSTLAEKVGDIRAGLLWGPPALPNFTLPNMTYQGSATIYLGDLAVGIAQCAYTQQRYQCALHSV
jgi:cyclase